MGECKGLTYHCVSAGCDNAASQIYNGYDTSMCPTIFNAAMHFLHMNNNEETRTTNTS